MDHFPWIKFIKVESFDLIYKDLHCEGNINLSSIY